jgi:uncharacterized membrane protein required for colicin V production
MPDTLRFRNHIALAVLIVGKVFGIAGLVVGSTSRLLGGALLGLDGVLIVAAVVLCLHTMKARSRQDDGHKDVLRQMMREGTLKQYLRDLEAEKKNGKSADSESEPNVASGIERSDESQTAFS